MPGSTTTVCWGKSERDLVEDDLEGGELVADVADGVGRVGDGREEGEEDGAGLEDEAGEADAGGDGAKELGHLR